MLLVPGISQPPSESPSPLGEKTLRVQVIPLARPALPAKGIQQKKGLWSLGCSHKPSLPSLTCQSMILKGLFNTAYSIVLWTWKYHVSRDSESLSAKLCLIWFPSPWGSGRAAPYFSSSGARLFSLPKHLTPECDQHLWTLQVIAKQTLCATTFATLLLQASCIKHQSWYVAEITEPRAISIVQLSACNLCSTAFNIQVLLDIATTQNCIPRSPFYSTQHLTVQYSLERVAKKKKKHPKPNNQQTGIHTNNFVLSFKSYFVGYRWQKEFRAIPD